MKPRRPASPPPLSGPPSLLPAARSSERRGRPPADPSRRPLGSSPGRSLGQSLRRALGSVGALGLVVAAGAAGVTAGCGSGASYTPAQIEGLTPATGPSTGGPLAEATLAACAPFCSAGIVFCLEQFQGGTVTDLTPKPRGIQPRLIGLVGGLQSRQLCLSGL